MKIFFTASQRGKKKYGQIYKKISEVVNHLGYVNLDESLIKITSENFYKKFSSRSRQEHVNFYKDIISKLKMADVNLFECSEPSLGIGYQVTKSLEFNKPTIILHHEKSIPHVFFLGSDNDKLILKDYNEKNLGEVLKKSLKEAGQRADKRFNFFIRPSLLNYLQKVSKEQGITKSTFIRNLIIEHMRKYVPLNK